jgi:hypothetical protein
MKPKINLGGTTMNFARRVASLLLAAAFAVPAVVFAQGVPQAVTVYGPVTRDLGALKVMTAQGAGTVTSSDQVGFNVSRVVCAFAQSTFTGSPSTTFKIQNKDAVSGLYYDLITNSAVTTGLTASAISAGAGVATTANVGAGIPIAAKWRVSITVGGSSTPTVTGTVGCSVQ